MRTSQSFTIFGNVAFALAAIALQSGCSARPHEDTDRNTHFLTSCSTEDDCGSGLECVCGVCTTSCTTNRDCRELDRDAVCESTTSLDQNCGAFSLVCQDKPEREPDDNTSPPSSNTSPPSSNGSNDYTTGVDSTYDNHSAHYDSSYPVPSATGQGSDCTSADPASGAWTSGAPSWDEPSSAPPDVTTEAPPIPPLDCTAAAELPPEGPFEPTEAYAWDGNECVRFIDTSNSARYLTLAQCKVAYVACTPSVPVAEQDYINTTDHPFYRAVISRGEDAPWEAFTEWSTGEWIGWEDQGIIYNDCPDRPELEACPSTRVLKVLTDAGPVDISVTQPWSRPIDEYFAPERVKFRRVEWDFFFALEVVDAADETPVLLVLHSFSNQNAWRLGNLQVQQGYPIAHMSDSSRCLTERIWTSTLVNFRYDDGESSVKRAFPTLEEVELQPLNATELTDPNTGHTFHVNAGYGITSVPTPSAPDCGRAAFHQQFFAQRLK